MVLAHMKEQKPSPAPTTATTTSRRRFTGTIAAALVAAPLIAVTKTNAQKTTPAIKPKEAVAPPNPQPSPQPAKPSPLALAYLETARLRFGDKLTAEEIERVRQDLEGNVRNAERLRGVKLRNADEPDFVFTA